MATPPVLAGAVHDRLIVVCSSAIAFSDLGALGAVAAAVVALATEDTALLPTELNA